MATKKKPARANKRSTRDSLQELKKAVAQAVQGLRSIRKLVPGLTTLDAEGRKRVLKPRKGGEEYAKLMDGLVTDYPDLFHAIEAEPGEITLRWERAKALGPLHNALAPFFQAVDDTVLDDVGTAWARALEVYGLGDKLAPHRAELKEPIEAFRRFLSTGKREDGQAPAGGSNGS